MIQKRRLGFPKSPDYVQKVKSATKDDQILAVALESMQPWTPEVQSTPPAPATGSVLAICEPFECDIAVNGTTFHSEGGKRLLSDLAPGALILKFSEDRYETQEKSAQVLTGKRIEVSVKLKLTNLEEAKHWRDEMWKALAAGKRGEGAQDIAATGTATIYDGSGKETDWTFIVKLSPTTSTMELRSPSGNKSALVLECHGETDCKQLTSPRKIFGGNKSSMDAEVATIALRDFRQNHLGSILKKLSSSENQIVSTSEDPAGIHVLHFKDSGDEYEVRLTPSFLIAQVTIRPGLGLGNTTVITYGEYEPLKNQAQYPKKTVYKSGDKRGFKAELTWAK